MIRIVQYGTEHDHANGAVEALGRMERFELLGVCEPDPKLRKKYEQWPQYAGVRWLTEDEILELKPDAIAVETKEEELTSVALRFAKQGYHIQMDKPGSMDIAEFEELINTVREKNLVLGMGYMYRFNPAIQKCREMLESGELGRIHSIEAQMSVHHPVEKRQWLGRFQGGMMYYLGCHLIDIIYSFMGKPDELYSLNCATGNDGVEAKDLGFAVLKYKDGVAFAKTDASEINGFGRRNVVVSGENATVQIHPFERHDAGGCIYCGMKITRRNDNIWSDRGEYIDFDLFRRYDKMMGNFADRIEKGIDTMYTPDYELELQKLIIKACE